MTSSRQMENATLHPRSSQILADFNSPSASAPWLLCDRHPGDQIAFRFIREDLSEEVMTYTELKNRSLRAAAALARHGVRPGDRVASLLGKGTDLPALILGMWRLGAVYVPLFTAFAATTVAERVIESQAKVIVTDRSQLAKTDGLDCTLMLANGDGSMEIPCGVHDLTAELTEDGPSVAQVGALQESDEGPHTPIVHMFTSGTTGKPKAVVHTLDYVGSWQSYLELGLVPGDSFWCGADPGWAYGLYTAIVAPLAAGRPSILASGAFKPDMAWEVLRAAEVTDFAATPTIYRALRGADPGYELPHLCRLSGAGEPLTPEVGAWARERFGADVHDHFGQTELGMSAGFPHHRDLYTETVPGAMGRALPGWSLTVLKADSDEVAEVDEVGRLAIDVQRSAFFTFTGYGVHREVRAARFTDDGTYYLSGDLAAVDADGLIRFLSRDDDVILMAGYRIGPFDVENVLLTHAAVSEVAVVASPDEARGEVIHAFVVPATAGLLDDVQAAKLLTAELQEWVKVNYAAHAYPRVVSFVERLPKTPSGKVQRSTLRKQLAEARELRG